MKVFHGNAIEVREPEIRTSKFTKDFGEGFYCTKLKRQTASTNPIWSENLYKTSPNSSTCPFSTAMGLPARTCMLSSSLAAASYPDKTFGSTFCSLSSSTR